MTGLAKFNLMWLLLKGEALQHFNNKAEELGNETNMHHTQCINVVSAQIFPKKQCSSDAEMLLPKGLSLQFNDHH